MQAVNRHTLIESYTEANNVGWKTFYVEKFAQIKEKNSYLHNFIIRMINEKGLAGYDIDIVQECIALLFGGIDQLFEIEAEAISTLEIDLIFQEKRREVFLDAERYLKSEMHGFYKEFVFFAQQITGDNKKLLNHILYFLFVLIYLLILSDFVRDVKACSGLASFENI